MSPSALEALDLAKSEVKKRGKYGRPCDMCAARRIRCVIHEGSSQCVGCQNHGTQCTNKRIRKKLGPKRPRRSRYNEDLPFLQSLRGPADTDGTASSSTDSQHFQHDLLTDSRLVDLLNYFQHAPSKAMANIPVDMLLPYLQVYQTWFYGYWPVLSVADLMLTMASNSTMDNQVQYIELLDQNAMLYALSCSVCAAIATQISFVTAKEKVIAIQNGLPPQVYADEARRVRNAFDYTANPSLITLLLSFFLYAHYVNQKGKAQQAIVYLREAISICQILGFHEPAAYVDKSAAEIHRWKKIYYMLLVTERFMCFEDGMPVILETCIDFPLLENEEYPSLLAGFTELVKVFSVPDKNFFGEINQKSGHMKVDLFRDYLQTHGINEKRRWIQEVQNRLGRPMSPIPSISDSQKLNIILSQSWIQAIAWHITSENGLLRKLTDSNDCFSVEFPLKIAHDFLSASRDLPLFAFESNGPGICVKLLEIANSLTFAIQKSTKLYVMAESLDAIFGLVNQFKNDVTLPLDVYNKVGSFIASYKNFVPKSLRIPDTYQHATVEEIFEPQEERGSDNSTIRAENTNDDPYFNIKQPGFTPTENTNLDNMGELVTQLSPGVNISPQQQLYIQAWNNVNTMSKLSPINSGTMLASMMNSFMQNTPSMRYERGGTHFTEAQTAEEPLGSSFTFT